jgi:hypothetical protein
MRRFLSYVGKNARQITAMSNQGEAAIDSRFARVMSDQLFVEMTI